MKRALYLAYIAGKLQESGLVEEMHFTQGCGNPLKPVLEVKPKGKLGKRVLVVVHLSPPVDAFKLARFSPEKNNVRPNWYFEENDRVEEGKKIVFKKLFYSEENQTETLNCNIG